MNADEHWDNVEKATDTISDLMVVMCENYAAALVLEFAEWLTEKGQTFNSHEELAQEFLAEARK